MTTARDVMNRGAQTVTQEQTLLDAAKLMMDLQIGSVPIEDADDDIDSVLSQMREHQVKRMPVLSDGSLVGMISESDLVAELSSAQVAHFAEGVYKKD